MTDIKKETVCFTGHRKIETEQTESRIDKLDKAIVCAIERGYKYFKAGGALGFDTSAANEVIHLKNIYPDIKLILILPCIDQTKCWKEEDIKTCDYIKSKADEVIYTSEKYTRGCMFKRNRYLVDNSNLCICYLFKNKGGTAYTVKYAADNGLEIVNLI